MSAALQGKQILLGITGGIASYKSAILARRLIDAGADVRVVMTQGAQAFITPLTFQALTGNPVHTDLLDSAAEAAMGHIELARWADYVLIAPATANVMARLANGFADDLLTTLCLANEAPLTIAPAMNRLMWSNPATQANLATLVSRGTTVIGPGVGEQACGEVGEGRMSEPEAIRDALAAAIAAAPASNELQGKSFVITAGPTIEAIDPVRFISNRSSGKMGFALATAAQQMGADVTLVAGPVALDTPPQVKRIDVKTADDMLDTTLNAVKNADVFIAVAAVADYKVAKFSSEKIKKTDDELTLELVRNPDILKTVAALKNRPYCVGFAAETQNLEKNAQGKLKKKKLDMIAANQVGQANNPVFGSDTNSLSVYWGKNKQQIAPAAKLDVARQLLTLIAKQIN
ncbi:MAG: bifunctional phosphopantothenoylcysteine decarboxylase/phosphopantothenate--cysteine ligase CoaBC [Granulosicoccaceae bacterium]